jgi:hypothetical protein
MHYLLKHKILQFVFKCLNVHFSAPTRFGPLGPSSGSIHQNLAKVTKITVFLKKSVKTPDPQSHATQQSLHTPQAEIFMHHTTTILTRCLTDILKNSNFSNFSKVLIYAP